MENEKMVQDIVQYIVDVGTGSTISGNWHVCYDELEDMFEVTKSWLVEHHYEIVDALDVREEVLSETWTDTDEDGNPEGFDCNFCGAYCPYYEEV